MTDRKEVEALLADCQVHTGRKAGLVTELCRTWLAVQGAPAGRLEIGRNDCDGEDMVEIVIDPDTCADLCNRRVRIVPDPTP